MSLENIRRAGYGLYGSIISEGCIGWMPIVWIGLFSCRIRVSGLLGIPILQGATHPGHAIQYCGSNPVFKRKALSPLGQRDASRTYAAIVKMDGVFVRVFGYLPDSQRKRD